MGVDGEKGTVCILLLPAVLSGVGVEKLPFIKDGAVGVGVDDDSGGIFFSPPAASNEECDCDSTATVGIGETFFDMESGAAQTKRICAVLVMASVSSIYLFYKVRIAINLTHEFVCVFDGMQDWCYFLIIPQRS